jgi:hypothetical protein
MLARALLAGGRVTWDEPRPRIAVPADWVAAIRDHADGVRDVLARAGAFRAQLADSAGRAGIPLLTLPGDHADGCFSCGAPCDRWRCLPCAVAVYLALDDPAGLRFLVGTRTPERAPA